MHDPEISLLRKQNKALTRAVTDLTSRLAALEAKAADLGRQHEVVQAAKANWRVVLRAQDRVVLSTEEGSIAVLPVGVAAVIAKDSVLDLEVRDDGHQVALVDRRGADVAVLPKGLLPVLSKVLATASIGTSSLGRASNVSSRAPSRGETTARCRSSRGEAGAFGAGAREPTGAAERGEEQMSQHGRDERRSRTASP